jgi:hypothetical protein
MPDDADIRQVHRRFEELGVETVRALLATDGFPAPWRLLAADWLARQADDLADLRDSPAESAGKSRTGSARRQAR